MDLKVVVCLMIFVYYLVHPVLIKWVAAKAEGRSRRLVWQYTFAALYSGAVAIMAGCEGVDARFGMVALLGAFNAFGCYSQWRAFALSMSLTALFTYTDDLIAMGLAYAVLGEGLLLVNNLALSVGVVVVVGAVVLFPWIARREQAGREEAVPYSKVVAWVGAYSVIWGVANFAERYFALESMSLPAFILAWYGGSWVGALVVFRFAGAKEAGQPLENKDLARTALVASSAAGSLALVYWAKMLAPVTVVQPIQQISEAVFSTLIGLYLFREGKQFGRLGKTVLAVGVSGGVLIALSYR